MGNDWAPIDPEVKLRQMSMCANRNIWGINSENVVKYRSGTDEKGRKTPNFDYPMGKEWTDIEAKYEID
jgi:hypothetical protein